ncbi:Acetyltransferase (GNAT) family protein [Tessaracoccus bendigoensis DSM 12906]|uniref:Acetyltransferase (GNAT) family protein n=1 Tax=Tessaracoccus bendigoensis DSM 12906 TaxID=1123357 RepID=A0A1M6INI5_9ACTN|nr:GNAT family N-acetyltransferase [Tessaracoccus bendigoensis]SHJ36035.1 Acetyltransferase (GNAT) family protein [Tessaracoccus bendigoensis DSM 12906]
MAISVRRVTAEDLEALRRLQSRPELGLVDTHFAAQQAGTMIFAVALNDGEPVGTALLDFDSEDYAPELRNMYVYPAARRLGAGRALSTFMEKEAWAAGHKAVYLAVDPNNERAVPLYVSLEYHPTGEHLFVEDPEVTQVEGDQAPSKHYAVYKKSLTAR